MLFVQLRLEPSDGLIAAQRFACQDRSATDSPGSGIGLKSGHKEQSFSVNRLYQV